MNRTKKVLNVIICVILFFSANYVKNNKDESLLKTVYALGDNIQLPDYVFSYNGTKKVGEKKLILPNQEEFIGNSLNLNQIGRYVLEYKAEFNGKVKKNLVSFEVKKKLFEVKSRNSSIYYGYHEYTPSVNGLVVALDHGDTLYYNDIINLKDLTKDDKILELYLTPHVIGEKDFNILRIRFTDVYDENNYIDIEVITSYEGINHPVSYMKAGASFQPLTGFEYWWNRLHRYNQYGFAIDMSFYGLPRDGKSLDNDSLVIAFDYDNLQLHSKSDSETQTMVVDFDDYDYFDELWHGFTTGEVRMEIKCDSYIKPTANFVIKNILGHDLSREYVEDNEGPKILVYYGDYSYNSIPNALVNYPYPIFSATALDSFSGYVDVNVEVFEDYHNLKKPVEIVNNTFIPSEVGVYTIVYSAFDESTNKSEKIIEVTSIDYAYSPTISIIDENFKTEAEVGEIIKLANHKVEGGLGTLTSSVKVFLNGTEQEIIDNSFIPIDEGTYNVVYTVNDYVGQKNSVEYQVNVVYGDKSYIYDDVVLPKYFVEGKEYVLPTLMAHRYSKDGNTKIQADIKVKDMRGEIELTDSIYIPNVKENGDTVEITYFKESVEKKYRVKVVKGYSNGTYNLRNYFDANESITVKTYKDGISLKTSENNAEATFINMLPANEVFIRFSIDELDNFLGGVDVILTDSLDPSVKLTAHFVGSRNSNSSTITFDGIKKYSVGSSFNGNGQFTLTYNDSKKIMTSDDGNVQINIRDFKGFNSGKVYLTIVFKDVEYISTINIHNICGQVFSAVNRDLINPMIIINQEDPGHRIKDEIFHLVGAMAFDMLDPTIDFKMTVRAPDGTIAKDINDLTLENVDPTRDYQLKLEKYGVYRIVYRAIDTSDNINERSLLIVVRDDVKPIIEYEGNIPKNAKVGEIIVAAKAIAKDNISNDLVVHLFVVLPTGEIYKLPGNSFVALSEGTYSIRYMVFDDAGNTTINDFEVAVSK